MTETPKITIDDLKHKAEYIRDTAKQEVREVVQNDMTRYVTIGVVAVVAAISVAYFIGARRCHY